MIPPSKEFIVSNAEIMMKTSSLVGAAGAVSHGISTAIQQIGSGTTEKGKSKESIDENVQSVAACRNTNLQGGSHSPEDLSQRQRLSPSGSSPPRSLSPPKSRKWFQRKFSSPSNSNGSSSQKIDKGTPYNSPSPMARMRDHSTHQALIVEEPGASVAAPIRKTVEQVKAEKQRKWKMKMKIAQKKKIKEQKELEGGNKDESINGQEGITSQEIAALIGYQFMDLMGHCGVADDVDSESDDSVYEDSGDEDEESQETDESPSHRSKKSRKPQTVIENYLKKSGGRRNGLGGPNLTAANGERFATVGTPNRNKRDGKNTCTPPRMNSSSNTDALGSISSPNRIRSSLSGRSKFPCQTPSRRTQPSQNGSPQTQNSDESERTVSSTVDPKSADFVRAFVYDMMEGNIALLWHKEKDSINPTRVTTRLKPGYRTQAGSYCAPRLVWHTKQFQRSYGINIFDIKSLERANPGDLKDYSFAMPSRTICLRMARDQGLFVFEARSENEAFRFVHGMRWVIARLSFNLVIGNMGVACELLDVGPKCSSGTQVHLSLLEEARRACAMDDLTDEFVERSIVDRQ